MDKLNYSFSKTNAGKRLPVSLPYNQPFLRDFRTMRFLPFFISHASVTGAVALAEDEEEKK
jgi:hypothetical protein